MSVVAGPDLGVGKCFQSNVVRSLTDLARVGAPGSRGTCSTAPEAREELAQWGLEDWQCCADDGDVDFEEGPAVGLGLVVFQKIIVSRLLGRFGY